MVLRSAFWQLWIGAAVGIPSTIEAANQMAKTDVRREAVGPVDVGLRYPAAPLRGVAGFDDSGIVRSRRGAEGGP